MNSIGLRVAFVPRAEASGGDESLISEKKIFPGDNVIRSFIYTQGVLRVFRRELLREVLQHRRGLHALIARVRFRGE